MGKNKSNGNGNDDLEAKILDIAAAAADNLKTATEKFGKYVDRLHEEEAPSYALAALHFSVIQGYFESCMTFTEYLKAMKETDELIEKRYGEVHSYLKDAGAKNTNKILEQLNGLKNDLKATQAQVFESLSSIKQVKGSFPLLWKKEEKNYTDAASAWAQTEGAYLAEIAKRNSIISDYDGDLQQVNSDLEQERDRIGELNKEIEGYRSKVDNLQTQLVELETKQTSADAENLLKTIEELHLLRDGDSEKIHDLERKLKNHDSLINDNKSLNERLVSLKLGLSKELEKTEKFNGKEVELESLKETIRDLESGRKKHDQELVDLKSEHEDLKIEARDYKKQSEYNERFLFWAGSQVELNENNLKKTISDLNGKVKSLSGQREVLLNNLQTVKSEKEKAALDYAYKLDDLSSKADLDLKGKEAEYSQLITEANDERDKAKAKFLKKKDEAETLTKKVESLEEQIVDTRNTARAEITSAKKEKDGIQQKLNKVLSKYKINAVGVRRRMQSFDKAEEFLTSKKELLQQKGLLYMLKIANLDYKLREEQEGAYSILQSLYSAETTNEGYKKDITELRESLSLGNKGYAKLESEFKSLEQDFEKKSIYVDGLESELKGYKESERAYKEERELMQSQIADYETQVLDLNDKNDEQSRQLESNDDMILQLQDQIDDLKGQRKQILDKFEFYIVEAAVVLDLDYEKLAQEVKSQAGN